MNGPGLRIGGPLISVGFSPPPIVADRSFNLKFVDDLPLLLDSPLERWWTTVRMVGGGHPGQTEYRRDLFDILSYHTD